MFGEQLVLVVSAFWLFYIDSWWKGLHGILDSFFNKDEELVADNLGVNYNPRFSRASWLWFMLWKLKKTKHKPNSEYRD